MKKMRELFFLLFIVAMMVCIIGIAAADEPTGPSSDNVRMHISVDGGIDSTSAVNNSKLFIANWKSMDFSTTNVMGVFCFDLTDGDLIWFRSIGEVLSTITVADGQVFVGTKSGELVCLDEETGNTLWNVSGIASGYWGLTGSPLVYDDVVYVTSPTQHKLLGYDTKNGNLVFQRVLGSDGGIIFTSPTLSSSNNLLVTDGTSILEISPTNDLINSYTLPSAITTGSTIVAHGDAVYLNANGILYRINTIGEWTEAWNISTLTSTTPVVTDTAVYLSQNGNLAAYNSTTGAALDGFTTHISGGSSSYLNPVLAGDTIYYAMNAHRGKVFAINTTTGTEEWSFSLPNSGNPSEDYTFFASSPVVYGENLFIGSEGAGFYVIGEGDLIEIDKTNAADQPYVPPTPMTVIYDDTVSLTNTSTGVTIQDALDAAVSAGGFTYNLSASNTIADINGIENAEDWSHSWMTTYYNNNEIPVYSVLDPVVAGATISIHYDEFDASWNVVGTQYLVNVTVGNIVEPAPWTVIYDGTVNLPYEPSITVIPANNLTAEYTIEGLTDLAALEATGLTYNLSDAWYWSYDPHSFFITDIDGIENTEDFSKYWGIAINGDSENVNGLGANTLSPGDYITFTYGTYGGTPEYIVNITVDITRDLSITSPSTMTAGSSSLFTALSTHPGNTTYTWDFDDNTTAVETKASGIASVVDKIYTTTGTKIITVTAVSENRSVTNTAEIIVTTPPAVFNESNSIPANLTGEGIPSTTQILFTGTDVTDAANITINITRYQNQSSISDDDWEGIQANYTIPNTNEKPLLILEIDSSNADGVNNVHQLNNYARFTVHLSIDYANASNVSFYRYVTGSNNYEQLHYTIGNIAPGWVEFLVDIPGFSTIIAVADEIPKDARTIPVSPTGTQGNQVTSQYKTIYYGTITIDPGSFTYTTTMDEKTFIVNNLSVFGILHASGMILQTKEWPGGIYIHSINGIAQDENLNGWLYQVNGMTTSQMSNNYMIHDGDKIVWYYSESMSSLPETSKYAYGFTVKVNASPVPLLTLSPAETATVNLGIPDGVTISSGTPQRITIDASITKTGGFVNITENTIIITTPGLQMTIPVKNLIWTDEMVTAEIQNMTAELVPAAVQIKTAGIEV